MFVGISQPQIFKRLSADRERLLCLSETGTNTPEETSILPAEIWPKKPLFIQVQKKPLPVRVTLIAHRKENRLNSEPRVSQNERGKRDPSFLARPSRNSQPRCSQACGILHPAKPIPAILLFPPRLRIDLWARCVPYWSNTQPAACWFCGYWLRLETTASDISAAPSGIFVLSNHHTLVISAATRRTKMFVPMHGPRAELKYRAESSGCQRSTAASSECVFVQFFLLSASSASVL